eukprot:5300709-Pleurochrysis_carterae.AAC.3
MHSGLTQDSDTRPPRRTPARGVPTPLGRATSCRRPRPRLSAVPINPVSTGSTSGAFPETYLTFLHTLSTPSCKTTIKPPIPIPCQHHLGTLLNYTCDRGSMTLLLGYPRNTQTIRH